MEAQQAPAREVILVRESHEKDDSIDLIKLILVFKRRWAWLVIPSVIVTLCVGLHTCSRPRLYQAETTLVPPIDSFNKSGSLGVGGLQGSVISSIIGGGGNLSEMYVGILQSRSINESIVKRFTLEEVYTAASLTDAIHCLQKRTNINVRKDGIIVVRVADVDPERASAIANAFVEELDKQNRRLSGGSAASKRKFLENRLKELQHELSSIDHLPVHESKIKEMIFETLSKEYELARIEEAKSLPTIQVLDLAIPPTRGLGRGTVKKSIMVGICTLMIISLLVFIPEYCSDIVKRRRPQSENYKLAISQEDENTEAMVCEFRSQRQVVSAGRKKGIESKV